MSLRASHTLFIFLSLIVFSCSREENVQPRNHREFEGYHVMLDEILRSRHGVIRGLNLNASPETVKGVEKAEPTEDSEGHLFYEYKVDSITNYSIDYAFQGDSLEEINVQINIDDPDLASYLFCDLKDYYANKLPNPTEDKGYVIYNCFEGERKPFVVSLSDNSSPAKGIINMVIYKDK
jgi:hypothetical protein